MCWPAASPDFMAKAAEAGCSQVFIGMETINSENLASSGKRQNKVEDYRSMIDAWHSAGIACHVGYIIGFPFDTPQSVREDIRRLREEIRVDQASFFMLTPLPGSQDHVEMQKRGDWMEPDYNKFDSFHATALHPRMSGEEWFETYNQVWRDFYTVDSMKSILARANNWTYWGLFKNFVWYKYALIERTHPMICGFFRLKDRTDRRPGYAIDSVWTHARRRIGEVSRVVRDSIKLYFEMQEVWLGTRGRTHFQANMDEIKRRVEGVRDKVGGNHPECRPGDQPRRQQRAPGGRGSDSARPVGRAPCRRRYLAAPGPFAQPAHPADVGPAPCVRQTEPVIGSHPDPRAPLNDYWKQTYAKLRRGRVFQINPFRLTLNFIRDAKLCTVFSLSFLFGFGK